MISEFRSLKTRQENLKQQKINRLTRQLLLDAVITLGGRDPDLKKVIDKHGPPPLWSRKPGFATLLLIILEQQVSLASARAVYTRLESAVTRVSPEQVVKLKSDGLRQLGFTRQKAGYCYELANSVSSGNLNLDQLAKMNDAEVRNVLTGIRGVGPWTADIYLLMALRRQDIWPTGDLALAESTRRVKRMRTRPDYKKLEIIARNWKPWRSVAARILWHAYLAEN